MLRNKKLVGLLGSLFVTTWLGVFSPMPAAAGRIKKSDIDGDGLTNKKELKIGTDPANPDSDADGIQDGTEVKKTKTDPTNPDTDGDTLDDGDEIAAGTSPKDADSDDDGLEDGTEVEHGTDPNDSDSDDDGVEDGDEDQGSAGGAFPDDGGSHHGGDDEGDD